MNTQDLYSMQRTPAGLAYDKARAKFFDLDPEIIAKAKADLHEGLHRKDLSPGDVYANRTIQTMSIQYANDDYIGDRLMPIVDVGDQPTGNYFVYNKRDRLAAPSDLLADRGQANEIEEGRTKVTYSTDDYGLQNSISAKSLDAQDAPLNEMMDLTESILELMSLKREQRQAAILTNSSNYASGQTTTLSGSNQWSSASGGDPIKDLQTARAACWTGRGRGVFRGFTNRETWDVMARHPMLLDYFKYTAQGLLPPDVLAKWIGLDTILVGDARQDTANEGQTASYSRIWGKYFGIVRVATTPSVRNVSFGYTLRVNGRVQTSQWFDNRVGLKGRYFAKVACSDDYKVVANDAGYLIVSPIS